MWHVCIFPRERRSSAGNSLKLAPTHTSPHLLSSRQSCCLPTQCPTECGAARMLADAVWALPSATRFNLV